METHFYPHYQKYSPKWLAGMIKRYKIGASYFARNENFDMANECLCKIQKYQNILDNFKTKY